MSGTSGSLPTRRATRPCPYCGRLLKAVTVKGAGDAWMFCGFERCGCKGEREAEEAERERERRHEAEALRRSRIRAGVPRRYADAVHPDARGYAERIARGRALFVIGPVGTGKTYLVSAVCRELQAMGKRFRMLSSVQLLERYRACYDGDGSELSVTGALVNVPVLVIDDLGKEAPTDWAVERLFRVVDERYNRELPTVVTTQFERPALIKRLSRGGDAENAVALISRLYQTCDTVRTDGADRRLS